MTMTVADPVDLVGFVAFDRDGEELGEVEGVYMGADEPEWAALLLPTGRFAVVPLFDAEVYEDSLDLPFTTAEVVGAPFQQAALLEDLTEEQEDELTAYFSGSTDLDSHIDSHIDSGIDADADPKEAAAAVASTARDQGKQVAATAADQTQQVAATAKAETQRVASTAKAQGQQVLRSTADQAGELVGAAREEAAEVADQAAVEARNLLEETRTRLEQESAAGAQRLGEQLQRLGEEALALAAGRPDEAPTVQGYAKRAGNALLDAADRAYGVSDDIQDRGIGGLLSDAQAFARRRPGAFLLGAAAVGVLAGRAVKAVKAEEDGTADEPASLPLTGSRGAR